nr:TldD/PmbA family protein [candidate division Zixibacteria bacterium]
MSINREKLARLALNKCRQLDVEYADVRFERIEDENISISSGTVEPIERTVTEGLGIRVIHNGAWGFASTDDLSEDNIRRKAEMASEIAQASALVNEARVVLAPLEPAIGRYISPYEIDPFSLSLEEKINFLREIDSAMAISGPGMDSRTCFASFRKREKYFTSTDGADIQQFIIQTGGGLSLGMTPSHRERYERSFPTSSGQYESKGYELLEELNLKEAIPRLAEEIKMLTTAEECPVKETTLVLSGDQVSLQIHESIGHALELDRVFGAERNFSGTSFATPDKLGNLQFASDIVTVRTDGTVPHALASCGYDDEGVPSYSTDLIRNGLLVNYLSSRETAARIGKSSTAAMRANSWRNIPIVRICNILLEPGNKSFDQIISEVDDGIYMDTVESWSIDDERKYFQFGCEIGWLIEGGKLTRPVKNPTYSGCTTDFWNRCSAIADRNSYRVWGTPNCGKGQPGQNARTAQGAAPARFDRIQIGE